MNLQKFFVIRSIYIYIYIISETFQQTICISKRGHVTFFFFILFFMFFFQEYKKNNIQKIYIYKTIFYLGIVYNIMYYILMYSKKHFHVLLFYIYISRIKNNPRNSEIKNLNFILFINIYFLFYLQTNRQLMN